MKDNITKPIVLIGMMGSGKSTIGRKLARKLNLRFYDSDKVLEEREGLNIMDIHEFMGIKYFQEREEEIIKEIIGYGKIILSTGGSSFMNKNIRKFIKEKGVSIWLDVNHDTIFERVSKRNTRPELFEMGDNKQFLIDMINEREPIFREADIKIDSDLEAHHLVGSIIKKMETEYLDLFKA
ncbi:MAG: shikimate kinase [Candidatus Midichloriaceae bacterium]|jgi:shikimate kinase